MSKLKALLVGPGAHAQKYLLPSIELSDSFELVAVVGGNQGNVVAARHGSLWFSDLGSALDSVAIDVALIATPPAAHFAATRTCLEQGVHVLCEKPLCTTAVEVEHLTELARSLNLVLYEGFMFLVHPQFQELKKALSLSQFKTINARFGFPDRTKSDFRYSPDGGGALLDAGVYPIAAACEILDNPRVVGAFVSFDTQRGIDRAGLAILEDSENRIGIIEWAFGRAYVNDISAWGEAAVVHCERAFSKPPDLATSIVISTAEGTRSQRIDAANHFDIQLGEFARSVDSPDLLSLERIRQRFHLIEEVRELQSKGHFVE